MWDMVVCGSNGSVKEVILVFCCLDLDLAIKQVRNCCDYVMILRSHKQSLTCSNTAVTKSFVRSRDEDNERRAWGCLKSSRRWNSISTSVFRLRRTKN